MSNRRLRHLAGAGEQNGTRRRLHHARPALRLTPYAWAKLLFLRDAGPTEVGGFGISTPEDCFLIQDIRLVRQKCTRISVEFADDSVADFFDEQVDLGRKPEQFARIWVHTHPGDCPNPSGTDEETFARAFGRADWSVMLILARDGSTYARLQFRCGPGGTLRIPMRIDYAAEFAAADHTAWRNEYDRSVQVNRPPKRKEAVALSPDGELWDWNDLLENEPIDGPRADISR